MKPDEHRHLDQEEILRALETDEIASDRVDCGLCRRRIQVSRDKYDRLKKLRQNEPRGPGPDCLSDARLAEIVTGTAGDDAWMEHVCSCDWCGRRLKDAMDDMTTEATDEEKQLIAGLASASPRWQQDLAARIAAPRRRPWIWYAAAAAVIVVASGVALLRWNAGPRLDGLLAEAYTQDRRFEFRLPDRGYAPVNARRGAGSPLNMAPALLEAEAAMAAHESRSAGDKMRRGTASLLEMDAEEAVTRLKEAYDQAPDVDKAVRLAVAYAVRAESPKAQASDYGRALDLLSGEARQHPDNLLVLFNLALVDEHLQLVDEAAGAWQQYLDHDSRSGWAEEARKHLDALREKKSDRERMRRQAGEDEKSFLAHGAPEDADDYLERTAVAWLAHVRGSWDAREAAARLANVIEARHHDPWLREALAEAEGGADAGPLVALIDRNQHGEWNGASASADGVASDLERRHANALAARARLEQVYALHVQQLKEDCVAAVNKLETVLQARSYRWMEIQDRLEGAVCASMRGEEGGAIREYESAGREAREVGLNGLALRAAALEADARTLAGDPWAAWEISIAGLERYWRSGATPSRAQQFYFNLARAAELLDLRVAAFDLASAAVAEWAPVGNRTVEAMGDARVAAMASRAGLPEESARYFERAVTLLSPQEKKDAPSQFERELELDRAEAELAAHGAARARVVLPAPSGLPALPADHDPFPVALRERMLRGRIALASGEYQEATRQLQEALGQIGARLDSLKTPAEQARVVDASSGAVRALMEEMLAEGREPDRALDLWLRFRSGALHQESAGMDAGEESWLVYVVLQDRVAAWMKTRGGSEFRWIGVPAAEISRQGRELMDLASDPRSEIAEFRSVSAKLYGELIEPFERGVAGDQPVVILDDGELAPVPFDLLAAPGRPALGESHPVAISSRFARDILRDDVITHSTAGLIVADGRAERIGESVLAGLTEAGDEGRMVASQLTRPVVLTDSQAEIAGIGARAPGAELFHFAGHGYSNGGNGALILGGEFLDSSRILKMDWRRCRLAVLSACLTAAGESRGPVNPNSLVRAFLLAGAGSVVAARWSVDSAATRQWMGAFYSSLLMGASAPAALRAAERATRALAGYQHPFYWGAFTAFQ